MDNNNVKTSSSEHCISITKLNKSMRGKPILNFINAKVAHGDVIALLGANAAGKSTLIETVLGFILPDEGNVIYENSEQAKDLSNQMKQRIGYVPQRDELIEFLTVEDYLKSIAGFYSNWNNDLLDSLIVQWRVPREQLISKLSVGQRQMVSILSAIGHEPDILILDEPVSSLDPLSRRKFLKALIELQISNNTTIIFSTHIVSDVERIANRLWILKEGELVLNQAIDQLKEDSDLSLEELFIGINQ